MTLNAVTQNSEFDSRVLWKFIGKFLSMSRLVEVVFTDTLS